jgi:hypothetical protein
VRPRGEGDARASSLCEEVERGRERGLSGARHFLKGPAAWSSGVGSLRAPRGGRRRGSIGPKPTEAGDSDQKRSQADRCGRRLDRGGGGKMGRQHVGLGATVSRSLTVQVIETEIQMISNKFKTI